MSISTGLRAENLTEWVWFISPQEIRDATVDASTGRKMASVVVIPGAGHLVNAAFCARVLCYTHYCFARRSCRKSLKPSATLSGMQYASIAANETKASYESKYPQWSVSLIFCVSLV